MQAYVAAHNGHRRLSMDDYSYINTKASKVATQLRLWDVARWAEEGSARDDASGYVFVDE